MSVNDTRHHQVMNRILAVEGIKTDLLGIGQCFDGMMQAWLSIMRQADLCDVAGDNRF